MHDNLPSNTGSNNEISLKDLFLGFKNTCKYLVSRWRSILVVCVIGAALGLTYSFIRKPTYIAMTSFVLDDGDKSSSLSQYAGLAAMAGINLSSGGGGLFQGENILQLYTSRTMIEKTLLAKKKFENKEGLLIDRYIDFNKMRTDWQDKPQLANITFNGDPANFSRVQDSVMTDVVTAINDKSLSVSNPDKKSSIIIVEVDSKDELFSKYFAETLVDNVNNFYIQTKSKKAIDNLNVLQQQADSVKNTLNSSISGVASSIDAAPNANPNMLTLKVPSQRKQVDVQANSAIYAEVVKNMEIAKMSVLQSKPLIQIIDQPVLPLKKDKVGKAKGLVLGGIIGFILAVSWLVVARFLKSVLE